MCGRRRSPWEGVWKGRKGSAGQSPGQVCRGKWVDRPNQPGRLGTLSNSVLSCPDSQENILGRGQGQL